MRIRHPTSFLVMLLVMFFTSALSVVWSLPHVIALVVDVALIGVLRQVALKEGGGAQRP